MVDVAADDFNDDQIEIYPEVNVDRGLARTIDLTRVTWMSVAWVAVFLVGSALRLYQIGLASLSANEAGRAWDSWALFRGNTEGVHNELSTTNPTGLLMRTFAFFLFGDTDTTVRIPSAIAGIGLIVLVWSVRDLIGEWRAVSVAALLAISPTAMFASRSVNGEIFGLFFGTLLFVTIFRFGEDGRKPGIGRALLLGVSLAAIIGSGPSSITLLVSLIITFAVSRFVSLDRGATISRALTRLRESRQLLLVTAISFVITLGILFTRFFSDPHAISGLGEVFRDWGRLLASSPGSISTQFFVLSTLLYEILAVVFAIKVAFTATSAETADRIDWSYPAVWFLTSLIIFSFSSGRQPEHAVLVAFPIILLGGFGLGDTLQSIFTSANRHNRLGLFVAVIVGVILALLATLILIGRVDTAIDRNDALVQVLAAAILALGPLVVIAYSLGEQIGRGMGWIHVRAGVFTAVAIVLAVLVVRSAIAVSFYRIDTGNEMLADQTSAADVRDIAYRTANLSRDVNGAERSPANPEGGKEMSIALDRSVEYPFRWYFREFPNLTLTAPGAATGLDAQMVIAPDVTGMSDAGYTPRTINVTTNAAPNLLDPSLATVLKYTIVPSYWDQGLRFLLYRDSITAPAPTTVVFGYSAPVEAKMNGTKPTYGLFDQAGQGSNPGQFNQPRGVAVSPDGTRIYVLDTQNGRIQVFDDTGALVTMWGDGDDDVQLEVTDNGLGPYGLAVGQDGLVYVADTWNHRIVVINSDGQVVRTFGEFGNNNDDPNAQLNPGTFYGPRGLTVYNNEVYVTDTGNERVEVFGLDGSFKRAFGGTGSASGQLLEPVGITVGADGNVYVADSGNARISVFDTNGNAITQWAIPSWQGSQFFEPYLTADSAGHIYVSDPTSAQVLVFDLNGNVVDTIASAGNTPLTTPAGLSILDGTNLLVADRGSSEIYKVDLTELPGLNLTGATQLPGEGQASPAAASPVASPEASPAASPLASPGAQ